MQPPNPTFSDIYAHQRHQQTSQYYSHFPSQNPNPYALHQQRPFHIEPHFSSAAIDPDPPGVDSYLSSYSISHAGVAYSAHNAGGMTYSHAIGAQPPPSYAADMVAHNWAVEEPVQQYGSTLYAVGTTVAQDVSQQLLPAMPTHTSWTNPNPTIQPHVPWKKFPKKVKVAQSAWCEICKIECNTRDVLNKHKLGKKHIKNLQKLNAAAASIATTSAFTYPNPAVQSNPVIGPLENPKKISSGIKKKAETPQDLEIKRRKVVEGGAAANAVRTCGICNVVCNSDTVFRFHLAGQKHASMLKKAQQAGTV